ncbi:MAG TPA: hypothetical protein PKE49_00740 [Leptospiraceae bacterium]|nr:hypothetical protein [Leptospirales bacterium]HMU81726.1 hypothetical protein [Leptospiraceae bacterium]HMW58463.1 hypothetical protein [Leptospiraceae bacterium]HMX55013.1 hypothetical protein [Leptospiraceae bacterium]HMY47864.1 hypothetical protein [Leptospiraceae bacterium]
MPKLLELERLARQIDPDLECLVEYRGEDDRTGIQFRDCIVDYTACQNQTCIKKLM